MSKKLTKDELEQLITNVDYQRYGQTTTLCFLTIKGGFIITGKSACLNPADFDEDMGKKVAFDDAFDKIWELEGYHRVRSGA